MSGKELRQLRHMAGLTQEQAARLFGVAHRTVLRWESGESKIKSLKAEAIKLRLASRLFSPQGEIIAKDTYR